MKSQLMQLFLTFGSVCLFGTALSAQSYQMAADVPFGFHANGTEQTPGRYVIETSGTSAVQLLHNETARRTIALCAGNQTETNKGSARLVFHRYGDQYFLAEVWNTAGTGSKLRMSRLERNLKESANPSVVAEFSIGLMAMK